jgi:hypothetical protein
MVMANVSGRSFSFAARHDLAPRLALGGSVRLKI